MLRDAKWLAQGHIADSGFQAHLTRVSLHMALVPHPIQDSGKGRVNPQAEDATSSSILLDQA